jgi:hypothetical protein
LERILHNTIDYAVLRIAARKRCFLQSFELRSR